ncbi:MAG TPA: hypothetical protein VGQ13_08065 [Nitrososphaera sp.]|nr:hypothetical protein [Nitrososphaera sp.]
MKIEHKTTSLTPVIESAFDILGTSSKDRLFQYLLEKYDIDIKFATKSDVSRIHRAIVELFGRDAAELLMKQVYSEMDKIGDELE